MVDDCASDSLEHGNPANMAQPSNTDSSLLEALPDELLVEVFEQLVYDKNELTWRDDDAAHTPTFHSLCLVSKRIDIIARPYLFNQIHIEDAGTLVMLYATISGNQQLGGHITEVDLDMDLDKITELNPADREKLRNDCYQHTKDFWPEKPELSARECDLIGILCYKLLARAVNLSSLVMRIDLCHMLHRNHDPIHLLRSLPYSYLAFFDSVRRAIRSDADKETPRFLTRLETLTFWCFYGSISVEAFKDFLDLPSLRTVESITDDGNWWRLLHFRQHDEPWRHRQGELNPDDISFACPVKTLSSYIPKSNSPFQGQGASTDGIDDGFACRNITTLDLAGTYTRQDDLDDIAQLFPCLEVLSVQSEGCRTTVDDLEHEIRRDLSTTLAKMASLRTFKTDIYFPDVSVMHNPDDDLTTSLGPGNVLNLAQLPNLQHIEVPLYMFAHQAQTALGVTTAVPQKALPRSLKSLVLLARLSCQGRQARGSHVQAKCLDSMTAALEFLEAFGAELPFFPHFESVTYSFDYRSCGSPFSRSAFRRGHENEEAEFSTRSRLEAISASFSKQNVDFLLRARSGRIIDLQELEE